jgi:hypothetical protein
MPGVCLRATEAASPILENPMSALELRFIGAIGVIVSLGGSSFSPSFQELVAGELRDREPDPPSVR